MQTGQEFTIANLVRYKPFGISLTWLLTLVETALTAIVPLFIGFAIDALLKGEFGALIKLSALLGLLVAIGVGRRIYDTRVYGTLRAELAQQLVNRARASGLSTTNARVGMSRELVDFLEEQLPELLDAIIQLAVSLVILYWFHPVLSLAAMGSSIAILALYLMFHRSFFRLNGRLNHRTEMQVDVLKTGTKQERKDHFQKLRKIEINISDAEALLYGAIFLVLLAFVVFNIWFTATTMSITPGTIFSVVTYSWEFVAAALILPTTLQYWTRLSEITLRINRAR